ncbi:MAG: hypothetical protein WC119_02330 [Synergistaceae bacterium]
MTNNDDKLNVESKPKTEEVIEVKELKDPRDKAETSKTLDDVPFMQTYTGLKFYPTRPSVDAINLMDIAHSLSMQCRFNGHCLYFYSVAEHSVRVSRILRKKKDRLWGLLHDASEAYASDVVRPVKVLMPSYNGIEESIQKVIAERFDLPWPIPEVVKHADDVLLMTERRDLLLPTQDPWTISDTDPLSESIVPMTSIEAELAFLQRFNALMTSL